jgi:hypothetical protein
LTALAASRAAWASSLALAIAALRASVNFLKLSLMTWSFFFSRTKAALAALVSSRVAGGSFLAARSFFACLEASTAALN